MSVLSPMTLMKYATLILSLITLTMSAHGEGWKLVWGDEFNYHGLPDPTKWNYEEGFIRNQERQYYTRGRLENARVEGGNLVIEARKEPFKKAGYTSASLTTMNKASWCYGKIEVRAKLPQGMGVWPAIWTLGVNMPAVSWPKCGEVDIMEFIGKEPNLIHATVHYGLDGKPQASGNSAKAPSDGFHVYALEWYPDHLDFYFDQEKYHTFPIDQANEGGSNPFRLPHYLLLNLALGGSWGGPIDDAIFPQKFLIDYVRVYRWTK